LPEASVEQVAVHKSLTGFRYEVEHEESSKLKAHFFEQRFELKENFQVKWGSRIESPQR
jgi:hypothetical protein